MISMDINDLELDPYDSLDLMHQQDESQYEDEFGYSDILSNSSMINHNESYFSSSSPLLDEDDLDDSFFSGEDQVSTQPEEELFEFEYLQKYNPKHVYMSLLCGPEPNQVKEFNILPTNYIKIHYLAKLTDYILVRLVNTDKEQYYNQSSIFMGATCAVGDRDHRHLVRLPNMKITKADLHGRTKGYLYYLTYTLVVDGIEVFTIRSNDFHIWSNVNQEGFPREQRQMNIRKRKEANIRRRNKNKGLVW